jgi:hypothetical protein
LTADRPDEGLAWLAEAGPFDLLAEIWETVDVDIALGDPLSRSFGGRAEHLAVADPATPVEEPLLGARVLLLTSDDGHPIAVAEPSREGRLAATLARKGEGEVGVYVKSPVDLDVLRNMAVAANVPLSRPAVGPFGRSVLVLPGKGSSRLVILVERPAVPSPA